jgi:hypothetical protein
MTGLLDFFCEAASSKIALRSEGASNNQRVFRSRAVKRAHVPQGVGAILCKSLAVKAQVIGLICRCAQDLLPLKILWARLAAKTSDLKNRLSCCLQCSIG